MQFIIWGNDDHRVAISEDNDVAPEKHFPAGSEPKEVGHIVVQSDTEMLNDHFWVRWSENQSNAEYK